MKTPFVCDIGDCRKEFASKYSLKRHRITHDENKRHPCPTCNKRFALPQYLREHMVVHSRERPFVCPFAGCSKTFRQAGKLSMHKRLHEQGLAGVDMPSYQERLRSLEGDVKSQILFNQVPLSTEITEEVCSPGSQVALLQMPPAVGNYQYPEYFETRILPPIHVVAQDMALPMWQLGYPI